MPQLTKDQLLVKFKEKKQTHLWASIGIDALGMASYIIPALGEFGDIIIAPITAVLIYMVHQTKAGAIAGFTEEILPMTDFIPTASIIWYRRYEQNQTDTFKQFVSQALYNETKTDIILNDVFGEDQKHLEE
jgi:hypothetical protein